MGGAQSTREDDDEIYLLPELGDGDEFTPKTLKFLAKIRPIHGHTYSYEQSEYINCSTRMKIWCYRHGSFQKTPEKHLKGQGCPRCGREQAVIKRQEGYNTDLTPTELRDKRAKEVHGDKYTYPDPYEGSNVPMRIICPLHGEFHQMPGDHINGRCGCQSCGHIKATTNRILTHDEFVKRSTEKHNGKYTYKAQYAGALSPIEIICPRHGPFTQQAAHHMDGHGCSACTDTNKSRVSLEWLVYRSIQDNVRIKHAMNGGEFTIPGTRYRADGFANNTVYEFHGDYWHGNPKFYDQDAINPSSGKTFGQLYRNTVNKKKMIVEKGYSYVHIWESQWKVLRETLPADLMETIYAEVEAMFA